MIAMMLGAPALSRPSISLACHGPTCPIPSPKLFLCTMRLPSFLDVGFLDDDGIKRSIRRRGSKRAAGLAACRPSGRALEAPSALSRPRGSQTAATAAAGSFVPSWSDDCHRNNTFPPWSASLPHPPPFFPLSLSRGSFSLLPPPPPSQPSQRSRRRFSLPHTAPQHGRQRSRAARCGVKGKKQEVAASCSPEPSVDLSLLPLDSHTLFLPPSLPPHPCPPRPSRRPHWRRAAPPARGTAISR